MRPGLDELFAGLARRWQDGKHSGSHLSTAIVPRNKRYLWSQWPGGYISRYFMQTPTPNSGVRLRPRAMTASISELTWLNVNFRVRIFGAAGLALNLLCTACRGYPIATTEHHSYHIIVCGSLTVSFSYAPPCSSNTGSPPHFTFSLFETSADSPVRTITSSPLFVVHSHRSASLHSKHSINP